MREYIGDLKEYFEVQYAKSGRSTCRKCKQLIDKNELRFGIHFDDEKFSTDSWFHLNCFQFKPRHRVLNIQNIGNHIVGTDQLTPKDYHNLIKRLKSDFKQLQERKILTKGKRSFEKHETEERKQQGRKYIKKSRRKPFPHEVVSKAQNREYQKLVKQYENYTAQELKQILEMNSQTKVGHKEELAARCADGKQFGRIPPCPKCGGGHLRFDREKGVYYCPGYMEDTDFVHCDGKFNFEDVQRQRWKE